ncbi:phage holin family protein [Aureivirga marina]|uniref:phage holin family protein n=1 Tax=Aureivirga marina TaxID=1182451 RepID=UPI0018C9430A|nr:phage holin family protein [Aureivirga marina]
MKLVLKILLTAIGVIILSKILPGVEVSDFLSAVFVAITLGFLRLFVKPILIFLTLPATIVTLGLFLFVINAVIILLASSLVGGFFVSGFWTALLFSLLLSLFQSLFNPMLEEKN